MQYTFSDKISPVKPSVIREIFKYLSDPEVIPLSAGNPAGESFPVAAMAKISADLWENNAVAALQYSITEGYGPLREKLKARLKTRFSIGRDFDELIITTGGQQGVDLTAKVLCNEGDTILCEAPSFIGSLNAFRAYNVKLQGIEMEKDGIDPEKLEQAIKANPRAKMLYIIPSFQNPTGVCTSYEKRRAIYDVCRRHGIIILEDNPYGELRFSGDDIPTLKSMDDEGIVVYDGSFSKVLSPGMRVGFLSAPAPIMNKIVVAKQVNDVHTNIFFQMLCDGFMEKYDMDAHIEGIRDLYRKKCALMTDTIDALFDPRVTRTSPEGGLFLWCNMPKGIDSLKFAARAIEKKVAVVPGCAFMPDESTPSSAFRLTYATPTPERIVKGIEILADCIKEFL